MFDLIRQNLIDLKDDGSYALNSSYFTSSQGLRMTGGRFAELFGGPPRQPESRLEQRHMDLAASVQRVTEDVVLKTARHAWQRTGRPKNLVMAGGVALNCVANGRLLREGPFEHIWIQPASGDAGGALGASLFAWHQILGKPRQVARPDAQKASLLGPHYSDAEIRRFLDRVGARYHHYEDEAELLERTATAMADGQIVGWFHGRTEYGPRALGARSILADRATPGCRATSTSRSSSARASGRLPPACSASTCTSGSRCVPARTHLTCSRSRRCWRAAACR